jgi:O-antigen/teichoic acid export membrane protein
MTILRAILETFIARGIYLLATIATGIIIARIHGPEGKGIYSLLLLIPSTLVALGAIGINEGNIYLVSKDKTNRAKLYTTAMFAQICLGLFLSLMFFLYWRYWQGNPWADLNSVSVRLALFASIIFFIYMISNNLLFAIEGIRIRNNIENGRSVGTLALQIIIGLVLGWSIYNFFLAWTIILLISTIYFTYYCIKLIGTFGLPSKQLLKDMLSFGLKGYAGRLFTFLNYRLSIILLKSYTDNAQVGLFNTALGLAELQFHLVAATQLVLFPSVASKSDKQEGFILAAKICRYILFMLLPLAIFTVVFAIPVIKITYGEQFLPCFDPLLILVPGVFLLSITNVLISSLSASGYPALESYLVIPTVILKLVLFVVLIPCNGMLGAAWGTTIGYFLQTIATLIIFIKISRIKLTEIIFVTKLDLIAVRNRLLIQ